MRRQHILKLISPLQSLQWLVLTIFTWLAPLAAQGLTFEFDYSLDSSGFFSGGLGPIKRAALEAAAKVWGNLITDEIGAINPIGGRGYYDLYGIHPETGEVERLDRNPSIPGNTLRVYVASQPMDAQTLAKGGPGGYAWAPSGRNRSPIIANISRGESGITRPGSTRELDLKQDFAPWGGVISFNSEYQDFHWNHRLKVPADKIDFYATCLHELGHVLGIGTSETWEQQVSGNAFQGPHAVQAYHLAGGTGDIPLIGDLSHWSYSVKSFDLLGNRKYTPLMFASATDGLRGQITQLDAMVLKDIGWDIIQINGIQAEPVSLSVTRQSGRITLSFESETGRTYELLTSINMRDWTVTEQRTGNGSTLEWILDTNGSQAFWKVQAR